MEEEEERKFGDGHCSPLTGRCWAWQDSGLGSAGFR
jgi:hypothetical protein